VIRTGWQRLVNAVLDCEKPVIAGVNGTAAGAACTSPWHATWSWRPKSRNSSRSSSDGDRPRRRRAWLLTRLVGIQKAKELFFFGDDVPASEAYRIGLVNRLVPRAELEATLKEMAERLAKGPTKAISMAKSLTNRALDVDRATSLHDEALGQELVTHTEDSREGIASFVERRPAEFKGW